MADDHRVRRYLGWVILTAAMAVAGWLLHQILPRSPVAILVLCVLAVLVMKLVELKVRVWFQRLEARRAADLRRSPPKS